MRSSVTLRDREEPLSKHGGGQPGSRSM